MKYENVKAAVDGALAHAKEKRVPLTMARIAALLGEEEETLLQCAEAPGGKSGRLLRRAWQLCRADLLEALMSKGCNAEGIRTVGAAYGVGGETGEDENIRFIEPGELSP